MVFLIFPGVRSPVYGQEKSSSSAPVLIIHQIRGNEECCIPGTIEMFEVLAKNTDSWSLPLSWAIRFDALNDESYLEKLKSLPKNHTLGLLLEVTPKLASASGVLYKSDPAGSDWREGRNGLLIGYTPTERKKIIDTLFTLFHHHFGYYPSLTAGWMIDSWSLGYMRETYGVRIHELTKEQFETDSYTLYGGVFNLPYFPSRTHPLVPAKGSNQNLDLMIIRQTVSDITKNYGSYQSFYTSQPNDYLKSVSGDFNYFTELIKESIGQDPKSRFALLGLENTSEWNHYKDEYLRQLAYIAEKNSAGELHVVKPYDYYLELKNANDMNFARILQSNDFPQSGAWWFFGSTYRARLEIWGGSLYLTDYRVYPNALVDPYQSESAHASRSYWVLPYVLDSSQQFTPKREHSTLHEGFPIRNDEYVDRFGIRLLTSVTSVSSIEGNPVFQGNGREIRFSPFEMTINSNAFLFGFPYYIDPNDVLENDKTTYLQFSRHPRFVLLPQKKQKILQLGWENDSDTFVPLATLNKTDVGWRLQPRIGTTKGELDSLSMLFQPDRSSEKLSLTKTIVYWHNTESIVGRGPIRLYIDPRNSLDRPVPVGDLVVKYAQNSSMQVTLPYDVNSKIEPFFVDFTASQPLFDEVHLMIDGNLLPDKQTLRFYPDCKMKFINCLKNPDDLIGFSRIYVGDIYQEQSKKVVAIVEDVRKFIIDAVSKLSPRQIPTPKI